jgi:hypothetical protein
MYPPPDYATYEQARWVLENEENAELIKSGDEWYLDDGCYPRGTHYDVDEDVAQRLIKECVVEDDAQARRLGMYLPRQVTLQLWNETSEEAQTNRNETS